MKSDTFSTPYCSQRNTPFPRNEKMEVMAMTIEGYVNIFGEKIAHEFSKTDHPLTPGNFVECFAPGAFQTSLLLIPKVDLKDNHGRVIGSTTSGELQLSDDGYGLLARAVIQDSEAIDAVHSGKSFGWSFRCLGARFEWDLLSLEPKRYCRTIKRTRLLEVSLLIGKKLPYPGSTARIVEE